MHTEPIFYYILLIDVSLVQRIIGLTVNCSVIKRRAKSSVPTCLPDAKTPLYNIMKDKIHNLVLRSYNQTTMSESKSMTNSLYHALLFFKMGSSINIEINLPTL